MKMEWRGGGSSAEGPAVRRSRPSQTSEDGSVGVDQQPAASTVTALLNIHESKLEGSH